MTRSKAAILAGILTTIAFFAWSVTAQAHVIERVSVASDGTQVDYPTWHCFISGDGRYVAFSTRASNLVPGDSNGMEDVFVRDRQAGTTERVSVATGGYQGNGESSVRAISADGRYVVFQSDATNLVPGDTNGKTDVFVRDRQTGTTERVSVATGGAQGNSWSYPRGISADGRYVVFGSSASNLVTGDTNGQGDAFVRDRQTGTTERVSVSTAGAQGNGDSSDCCMSADGRYVAFQSSATNLVSGDTNGKGDMFVHDRQTGATERVSVRSNGTQANDSSYSPSISADGRYVAFSSDASNLVPGDTGYHRDAFVHDRKTGTTFRVSVSSTGVQGNHASGTRSISADGRYVAFVSYATNLVPGDTNGLEDVFVRDLQAGTTQRVNVSSTGSQTNGTELFGASVSADGRYVAFDSDATGLVPGDTNGMSDVFVAEVELTPIRYEQTNPKLVYAGAWKTTASASASGGSFRWANSPGASVTIKFTGTHLAWIAKKSPVYGKARITLDGGTPVTIDLYGATTTWRQQVWNTGTLASGAHTVMIEWTGTRSAAASASNIGLDAVDVIGTLY
jgi:Tol biopolymer transport system component